MSAEDMHVYNDETWEKDNILRSIYSLADIYPDPAHFIYELLQNAEDAGATRVLFVLDEDKLTIHHNGPEPFSEKHIRGICGIDFSTKKDDPTKIGKFGIGFKSVYSFTKRPEVHCRDKHFYIDGFRAPLAPSYEYLPGWTSFILRIDRDGIDPVEMHQRIKQRLVTLGLRTLLFLRSIEQIEWYSDSSSGSYIREIKSENIRTVSAIIHEFIVNIRARFDENFEEEDWLLFSRPVKGYEQNLRVELAFTLGLDEAGGTKLLPTPKSKLVVFFPTDKDTGLEFLVQGPFQTTRARDNLPHESKFNQQLVSEICNLLKDSLVILRDKGLLTLDSYIIFPLDAKRLENKILSPAFDAVKQAFNSYPLIEAHEGGFVAASAARIASSSELLELLTDEKLASLFPSQPPPRWLSREISPQSSLGTYLRNVLNIREIRPESIASAVNEQFLEDQRDEWMIRFYKFLSDKEPLWRDYGILRKKAFIRLDNRKHITPFDEENKPQVFLPTEHSSYFETVSRVICSDADALVFLRKLKLSEPDLADEVEQHVLPKYDAREVTTIDELYYDDLLKIFMAIQKMPEKRERLTERLSSVEFVVAYSADNHNYRAFRSPNQVYLPSPDLHLYFDQNPNAWFVDPLFMDFIKKHDFMHELNTLAIDSTVHIEGPRNPHWDGHVTIAYSRGYHKRGLNGFDPETWIDGLDHALSHITLQKAIFIWNNVTMRIKDSISGVIESSGRQDFNPSTRKESLSEAGKYLRGTNWLPDRFGQFRQPNELALADLPDEFTKDEKLADQLGMLQDDFKKFAAQIRLDEKLLRKLASHPEAVAILDDIFAKLEKAEIASDENTYADEVRNSFEHRGNSQSYDRNPDDASIQTQVSSRRRERLRQEIERARREETIDDRRLRFSVIRDKDVHIRAYLFEKYGGLCQLGGPTFMTAKGHPFFMAIPLVDRTFGKWIDRPGNYLCLNAENAARWQHGEKTADEDIILQILNVDLDHPVLSITLCGEVVEVRYEPKHLVELQEMIKASKK